MPAGDLRTVRADTRLGSEQESFDVGLGEYHCVLKTDGDQVVVAVDTYVPGPDRDSELRLVGASYPPQAVLPGGLPGFEDQYSRVFLMPECPNRVKDPLRDERRLLVTTWTYFAETREEKAAMLRLAVRMTNEVTAKLGCGGVPLPAPKAGAVPDTGRFVPRAAAKGTACEALATTRVPEEGRDGDVRIAIADGGVVGRCTLHAPGGDDSNRFDHRGRPLVELTAWRGEWAGDIREMGSGPDPLPMGPGPWRPVLTEDRAWAVARCGGEKAGFAAYWGYDDRPREERERDGKNTPPTEAEKSARRGLLREYVTAFAQDQVRRGHCTGLELPGNPSDAR
ncbi:hypothetical protein ACF065_18450 [Streptomyces sp. NPDC015232]|uniref:hypothetical protein n=1 Tax=unclassified Streptomyces TaxID=2593676 RepID=UPI0037029061